MRNSVTTNRLVLKRSASAVLAAAATLLLAAAPGGTVEARTVTGEYGLTLTRTWSAAYARPGDSRSEFSSRLAVDADGSAYLLDEVSVGKRARRGFSLRKYRPNGTVAWRVREVPKGRGDVLPQAVARDSNGVVVAGVIRGGRQGVWLQRFTASGLRSWRRFKPAALNNKPKVFLSVDKRDSIYLTGTRTARGRAEPWVASYRADGKPNWERVVGYRWAFQPGSDPPVPATDRPIDESVPGELTDAIMYDGLLTVHVRYQPAGDVERSNSSRLVSYDPAGARTDGIRAVDRRYFNLRGDYSTVLSDLAPKPGKGRFTYRLAGTPSLSVWLEVARGWNVIGRVAIARAPEKPGKQFAVAQDIAADKQGNVYVAVLRSGDRHPRTELHRIEVKLPGIPAALRHGARRLAAAKPRAITPALAAAHRRLSSLVTTDSQSEIIRKWTIPFVGYLRRDARELDKSNRLLVKAAERLADRREGTALRILGWQPRGQPEWAMFIGIGNGTVPPPLQPAQDLLVDASDNYVAARSSFLEAVIHFNERAMEDGVRQVRRGNALAAKGRAELARMRISTSSR